MTDRQVTAGARSRAPRHHIDKRAARILADQPAIQQTSEDQALRTRDAAELLGVSRQFLELARVQGRGPKFIRLGPRMVRYLKSDLFAWLRSRAERNENR